MQRVIDGYFHLLQFVLKALLGLLLVPVTIQILSRYSDAIPRYIWTEEAARFLFIWIVLLGASLAVREETHFAVDILPRARSPRGKAAGTLIVDAAYVAMAGVFLYHGYEYAVFGYRQTSELTGINMLSIHVVFMVAGASWLLALGPRIRRNLALLLGGAHESR